MYERWYLEFIYLQYLRRRLAAYFCVFTHHLKATVMRVHFSNLTFMYSIWNFFLRKAAFKTSYKFRPVQACCAIFHVKMVDGMINSDVHSTSEFDVKIEPFHNFYLIFKVYIHMKVCIIVLFKAFYTLSQL